MADNFDFLYVTSDAARSTLSERQGDPALAKEVVSYLVPEAKSILERFREPRAVIFRQIATPNLETLHFLARAAEMGLKPLILEFNADRFVNAHNWYKQTLGKLPVLHRTGKSGKESLRYHTIVDFNTFAGKRLRDVRTHLGIGLVELHHDLLKSVCPDIDISTCCADMSDWFAAAGPTASRYYEQFLSLFVAHGILFEDFIDTPDERIFTQTVVVEAFKKVEQRFGKQPLITRLVPENVSSLKSWYYYPVMIKNILIEYGESAL